MHDTFLAFSSVDMLLLYPPFASTLVVQGERLAFKDALGSWRRRHCGDQTKNGMVAGASVTTCPDPACATIPAAHSGY